MDMFIKTFVIKSKGRKYFECTIGKEFDYKARLVITDCVRDCKVGQEIRVEVKDLSVRSRFGTDLKFEPQQIVTDEKMSEIRAEHKRLRDAEHWLELAETDARRGMFKTNAIKICLDYVFEQEDMKKRINQLKEAVAENKMIYLEDKKRNDEERAKKLANPETYQDTMEFLCVFGQIPAMNRPIEFGDKIVVFERLGRNVRIDDDHPSYEGNHLLGHEGELGIYCHYRLATEQEIESFKRQDEQI
jgi:hypothetical protein